MRDIVSFTTSILSSVGVPTAFQWYPPDSQGKLPNEYVTFLEYHDEADGEAGDEEITTRRLIQVNVWSRGNYHLLVNKIRKALEDAGFERTGAFDAPYTDGDSHFNKVLRFAFFDDY